MVFELNRDGEKIADSFHSEIVPKLGTNIFGIKPVIMIVVVNRVHDSFLALHIRFAGGTVSVQLTVLSCVCRRLPVNRRNLCGVFFLVH